MRRSRATIGDGDDVERVSRVIAAVALLIAGAALPATELRPAAHAAAPFTPDDPGRAATMAGWTALQWNFVGRYGVDAPHAWGNVAAVGAAGGAGVTVAVLDTGVAYPQPDAIGNPGSPDFRANRFVPGYDFVDEDSHPFDRNGHGTHVASTIAEQTDNGYGLTGLAYGVRIMPVRVLDADGDGTVMAIARGVHYAVDHGAKIINLSLNFNPRVTAREVPELVEAVEDAYRHDVLIVAGAGNQHRPRVSYPARSPHVLAVGATTDDGCLANYSNYGTGIDLVAPGGGRDANIAGDPHCRPGRRGAPIYQITLGRRFRDGFGITGYIGTSMASPHVAAAAALVVASGVIGRDPAPDAIKARLEVTARDFGPRGPDRFYGAGLVDAAAATSPLVRTIAR
jgi:serine protease